MTWTRWRPFPFPMARPEAQNWSAPMVKVMRDAIWPHPAPLPLPPPPPTRRRGDPTHSSGPATHPPPSVILVQLEGWRPTGRFRLSPRLAGRSPTSCLPPHATHHRIRWNPASLLLRRPPQATTRRQEYLSRVRSCPIWRPSLRNARRPGGLMFVPKQANHRSRPLARKKSQLLLREARPAAWLAQFPTTSMIFGSAMSSPSPPPLPVPSGLVRQRCQPTEAHLPVRCLQPTSLLLRCRVYLPFQGASSLPADRWPHGPRRTRFPWRQQTWTAGVPPRKTLTLMAGANPDGPAPTSTAGQEWPKQGTTNAGPSRPVEMIATVRLLHPFPQNDHLKTKTRPSERPAGGHRHSIDSMSTSRHPQPRAPPS
jgi:hypothetical protein